MVKSAYSFATKVEKIEKHIIVVWVDNEAGVLARVAGLFSGRGYNIDSLAVAEVDEKKNISRITIATSGTPRVLQQIKLQLGKLVPVHKVADFPRDEKIKQMLSVNKPVIFDCVVDKTENCYPMIPSGKPHNQMLLGSKDKTEEEISEEGKILV